MKTIETVVNGVKVVDVVLEEKDFATQQLREQRLMTCHRCPNFKYNEQGQTEDQRAECTECSCMLVHRVAYVESSCPIGKW